MHIPREPIPVIDSYLAHSYFNDKMDGVLSEWEIDVSETFSFLFITSNV